MKEVIIKTAKLARLKFPDSEIGKFITKAERILEYVEQLKELDTSKMEATSHATPPLASGRNARSAGEASGGAVEVVNAFREDSAQKFDQSEKILEIAPGHYQNLFEVPKVIE